VVQREYVWLAGRPIALFDDASSPTPLSRYVHVDHLDRPVMMTNPGGSSLWRATYRPFGEVHQIVRPMLRDCSSHLGRKEARRARPARMLKLSPKIASSRRGCRVRAVFDGKVAREKPSDTRKLGNASFRTWAAWATMPDHARRRYPVFTMGGWNE
jgi:hypothetical protein